jgi:hypothetical protein
VVTWRSEDRQGEESRRGENRLSRARGKSTGKDGGKARLELESRPLL